MARPACPVFWVPSRAGDYELTLLGLKRLIQDKEGIPPDEQHVFCRGRLLGPDTATLVQMQLSDGDVVEVRLPPVPFR